MSTPHDRVTRAESSDVVPASAENKGSLFPEKAARPENTSRPPQSILGAIKKDPICALASGLKAKKPESLIAPVVYRGSVGFLEGRRNRFKSTLAADIILSTARGTHPDWADAGAGKPGLVLVISEEPRGVVVSRLRSMLEAEKLEERALNAILDWIAIFDDAATVTDGTLAERIETYSPVLVVVDTIRQIVDPRRCRDALVATLAAARTKDTALLFLRHWKTGAGSRTAADRAWGSSDWGNVARSIMVIDWHPADDGTGSQRKLVLAWDKLSYDPLPPSRELEFDPDASKLVYLGTSAITAEDLGQRPPRARSRGPSARSRGADLLREMCSHGPRPFEEIESEAKKLGISRRSLYRAGEDVDIQRSDQTNGETGRFESVTWWLRPRASDDANLAHGGLAHGEGRTELSRALQEPCATAPCAKPESSNVLQFPSGRPVRRNSDTGAVLEAEGRDLITDVEASGQDVDNERENDCPGALDSAASSAKNDAKRTDDSQTPKDDGTPDDAKKPEHAKTKTPEDANTPDEKPDDAKKSDDAEKPAGNKPARAKKKDDAEKTEDAEKPPDAKKTDANKTDDAMKAEDAEKPTGKTPSIPKHEVDANTRKPKDAKKTARAEKADDGRTPRDAESPADAEKSVGDEKAVEAQSSEKGKKPELEVATADDDAMAANLGGIAALAVAAATSIETGVAAVRDAAAAAMKAAVMARKNDGAPAGEGST